MKITQAIIIILISLGLLSCTNPYEGEGIWHEEWIATINPNGDSLDYIREGWPENVQFTPDNTKIIVNHEKDGILSMNLDGTDYKPLTDSLSIHFALPSICMDSLGCTKITFAGSAIEKSVSDIYIMDIDGTNLQNLTNTPNVIEQYPHFSPDGSQIVYTTMLDTFYSISIMAENGNNKKVIISNIKVGGYTYPTFSSDGEKIYYHLAGGQERGLYSFNLADSTNRILFNGSTALNPISISDDGSKIVFSTSYIIYIMNSDGTGIMDLGHGSNAKISSDGLKIVFEGIEIMNADSSNRIKLAEGRDPVFSSDDKKIVFIAKREFPED